MLKIGYEMFIKGISLVLYPRGALSSDACEWRARGVRAAAAVQSRRE